MMYFDGSITAPGSGDGVVLMFLDGSRLRYAICLHFLASNNATEYEALINGLHIAIELGAMRLYVRGDSELVIDQVMKESSYKSPLMVAYCQELAAKRDLSPSGVFINDLHEPSTRILEGLIQAHPDANLALGGSDPNAKPALEGSDPDAKPVLRGSDPSASMTTSPTNVAVLALDQTD
ncbi:uncharacterized protein [Miscanthus floridulus]|uniref:uncharacterized protein n=1 Tax=Miscanthus floridulus TaxID=154761 RepID=UPI003458ADD5